MTMRCIPSIRNALVQALATDAGVNCKLKYRDGSRTTALGGAITTQQLLATVVFPTGLVGSGPVGGVGTLPNPTQNNTSHITGQPTWVQVTRSDDTVVADLLIPQDMAFTGSIVNGVDIALSNCTITAGNQ